MYKKAGHLLVITIDFDKKSKKKQEHNVSLEIVDTFPIFKQIVQPEIRPYDKFLIAN